MEFIGETNVVGGQRPTGHIVIADLTKRKNSCRNSKSNIKANKEGKNKGLFTPNSRIVKARMMIGNGEQWHSFTFHIDSILDNLSVVDTRSIQKNYKYKSK